MKKAIQKKNNKKMGHLYRNIVQLIAVGCITGFFAGIVVTSFTVLAEKGEELSKDAYLFIRENPLYILLWIVALGVGAFLLSVAVKISAVARGCGIPQAEGATRGVIRFKWFRDATTMFASSLLSIFMGLSIGAEGPSVLIGAGVGDGVASLSHRNEMIRRYQITGGACAGLAVASNAPLTGMVFAFEEAHKRFTPEVFICAFSSVVCAMFTRSIIYRLLGLQMHSAFHSYVFYEIPERYYGFVLIAGLVCGVLGVAFYKLCFCMRRIFSKIRCKKAEYSHGVRIAIAVFLGGAVSLLALPVAGGGHVLIESLGTQGGTQPSSMLVIGGSVAVALAVVLLLKFFITTVNVGSGIPCGIFIPMIAIGACIGGLLNEIFCLVGMERVYCDLMIMICMASFFATIVKAPLTAIIMICEFTGSFAPLLPVILAVSVGYAVGELSRTDGIYEELLEEYEKEHGIHEKAVKEVFVLPLSFGSTADRREVRDVLWPAGARVTEIVRGEEHILPDGDTVLHGGDLLTIVCKTDSPQKVKDELTHILD